MLVPRPENIMLASLMVSGRDSIAPIRPFFSVIVVRRRCIWPLLIPPNDQFCLPWNATVIVIVDAITIVIIAVEATTTITSFVILLSDYCIYFMHF